MIIANLVPVVRLGTNGVPIFEKKRNLVGHRGMDKDTTKNKLVSAALDSKPHGTGLGLAISMLVAQAHGGTIQVSSEPGLGSDFCVVLPLSADEEN